GDGALAARAGLVQRRLAAPARPWQRPPQAGPGIVVLRRLGGDGGGTGVAPARRRRALLHAAHDRARTADAGRRAHAGDGAPDRRRAVGLARALAVAAGWPAPARLVRRQLAAAARAAAGHH